MKCELSGYITRTCSGFKSLVLEALIHYKSFFAFVSNGKGFIIASLIFIFSFSFLAQFLDKILVCIFLPLLPEARVTNIGLVNIICYLLSYYVL